MLASEIIRQVTDEKSFVLIRNRNKEHNKGEYWHYDVKPGFTGKKKGWIYLDLFTASALLAAYNALSPENQIKWDKIHLTKLIDFTWRNVK